MLIEALLTLHEYNQLATGRVLDVAEGLTQEQWLGPPDRWARLHTRYPGAGTC